MMESLLCSPFTPSAHLRHPASSFRAAIFHHFTRSHRPAGSRDPSEGRGFTSQRRSAGRQGGFGEAYAAQPVSGKAVVITGASKGLGFAMAWEFLRQGDRVVICSRDAARLDEAAAALGREFGGSCVHSRVCDVSSAADIEQLAQFAAERLGIIDFWINNAGQASQGSWVREVWLHGF